MKLKLDLEFESNWFNIGKKGKIDKINVTNSEQIEILIKRKQIMKELLYLKLTILLFF